MTVSVALSEALRAEIRTALEAGGKPFSIAVARRVYDLAIAARDLLVTASGNSVGSAIEAVEDSQGPLDSVTGPSATPAPTIVAETFGARMIRELLAAIPMLRNETRESEDPKALVHALAEARRHGMTDVAVELEKKLFGRVLEGLQPVAPTLDEENDFARGYVAGDAGLHLSDANELYMFGYQKGTEARFLGRKFVPNVACALVAHTRVNRELGTSGDPDVRRALFWRKYEEECLAHVPAQPHFNPHKHKPGCFALNYGEDRECDLDCGKLPHVHLGSAVVVHRTDEPNCEAQGQCEDLKGDGACFGCGRWLGDENTPEKSGRVFERPPSGAENAFAPERPDDGGAS